MQILEILISSVFSLGAGVLITATGLNHSADAAARQAVVGIIDEVITSFQERYTNEPDKQFAAAIRFDYQMKSLLDDTTLLPIIGRRRFDQEYYDQITQLYQASSQEPRELKPDEISALLKRVNTIGVDIKKIVDIDKGHFRLFRRS